MQKPKGVHSAPTQSLGISSAATATHLRIPHATSADTDSLADLYDQHFDALVRFALALTSDPEVAFDLVQDAFVGLHRHQSSVRQPLAYLRRSVTNSAASYYRRNARRRNRVEPRPETAELHASELSDALLQLKARPRAALVMRYYLDLPDADIAEALNVRVGTVASLIHRSLHELRKAIS